MFGIPIKLDMSLIILFIMLFDPRRMIYSLIFTMLLLLSIVLHELGHSLVAIKYKCRIKEIVLMFMGGAAVMERVPRRPIQEFLMAIAGPAVSLVIGLSCLFLSGYFITNAPTDLQGPGGMGYIGMVEIIKDIGSLNMALVVFNLLPAFPMDGGRIFRAMLTPKFGRIRATRYAANMGKLFAVLFIVVGLNPEFISSRPDGIMWSLVIIGVFIFISAGSEYRMVVQEEAMRNNPFSSFFVSPEQEENVGQTDKDDDQVTISPPPYRKGEEDKTDISYDKKNPFDNFFGRKK